MKALAVTAIICAIIYGVSGAVKSSANTIKEHNKKIERALNGQF